MYADQESVEAELADWELGVKHTGSFGADKGVVDLEAQFGVSGFVCGE